MKRNHLLVASLIVITLGFIATLGINSASAVTTTVTVYPASRVGPYTAGTVLSYRVQIPLTSGYGAPHDTTEPAAGTDKTWAWEVVITYDNTVVSVTTPPYRDSTRDWFDNFKKWEWDGDMMEWLDLGPYGNFWAGVADDSKGETASTCTMTEDVTTIPIPEDDMGDPHDPGVHAGTYYDLPYSDGLVLPGYTSNFFILFNFRVTLLQGVGTGQPIGGTTLHISAANFIQYNKVTPYSVTTEDATIGSVPEFPLGLAPVIMLAPMIPIIYVWRTRKKRVR